MEWSIMSRKSTQNKKKYFGTDGVRGFVGQDPITPEQVMHLGFAAGSVLTQAHTGTDRPRVLIGKDTRISGYLLESALEAGLIAAGVDVHLVGPIPTPGVAYLTRALRLNAGIVISASHNPYYDNGIKFFSGAGKKLPDQIECEIEEAMTLPIKTQHSAKLGKAQRVKDAAGRYIEFCKSTFSNELDLRGLKIVIDCANGATYNVAPPVFHELGAEVIKIHDQPDGLNINHACGSTHLESVKQTVLARQAHLGIAFDGDGDRLLMVDQAGKIYDGDLLLYIIATHRQRQNKLAGGVVGTVMTNFGIEHAFAEHNIPFKRAAVGDRYVFALLEENHWQLGGEASGHLLCLDKHTTGDGIISALQVLEVLQETKQSLWQLTQHVEIFPQKLINVRLTQKVNIFEFSSVQDIIERAEQALHGKGRILLRPSGTEPVIRVMVEGHEKFQVDYWAEQIAESVRNII